MEVVSSNMCKTSEKGGISERSENGENSDLSEIKVVAKTVKLVMVALDPKGNFLEN